MTIDEEWSAMQQDYFFHQVHFRRVSDPDLPEKIRNSCVQIECYVKLHFAHSFQQATGEEKVALLERLLEDPEVWLPWEEFHRRIQEHLEETK
jgi:hypothetical protein